MYLNYDIKHKSGKRWIFVPNDECRAYGERLVDECTSKIKFPDHYYHYVSGGHVAALHAHIENRFFFKIDLENFYYTIRRNRVAAALSSFGISKARDKAKWSCVKNPYSNEGYVLPIGFVQSPILSSTVVLRSPLEKAIQQSLSNGIVISMYFDDFIGSSNDLIKLCAAFKDINKACADSNFPLNLSKTVRPTLSLAAFNCDLRRGFAAVSTSRVDEFYSVERTPKSQQGFEDYRKRVTRQNS